MRTMIDLGNQRGPLYIIDTPTSVDCTKDVRFRRSFRSLVECVVPCCGFQPSSSSSVSEDDSDFSPASNSCAALNSTISSSTNSSNTITGSHASTVTGTFFGYRKGRVRFCLQDGRSRGSLLLLLEFAVPTSYLAREMQHGLLRIALECDRSTRGARPSPPSLFSVPVWCMYCNGRKVGFAVRRQMTKTDLEVLKLMQSVSVGAGVLPSESGSTGVGVDGGDLMYLRANFERVTGSVDSESFHMINPVGCSGQELSIFFLRS